VLGTKIRDERGKDKALAVKKVLTTLLKGGKRANLSYLDSLGKGWGVGGFVPVEGVWAVNLLESVKKRRVTHD